MGGGWRCEALWCSNVCLGMKKKWFLIFGWPALAALVVMAGEAILFQRVRFEKYVVCMLRLWQRVFLTCCLRTREIGDGR
jgi:hypothetical protein